MSFDVPETHDHQRNYAQGTSKAIPCGRAYKRPSRRCAHSKYEQLLLDRAPCADHFSTRFIPTFNIVEALGQFTHLPRTQIALLGNCSNAIARVIGNIRWRRGDNVVVSELDYASGRYALAWNQARCAVFEPDSADRWSATPAADGIDYKTDTLRAEYGNANHLGTYMLRESLAYLAQFGIDQIARHVRKLSGDLIDGMQSLGLEVTTPAAATERAASAAFVYDDMQIVRRAAAIGTLIWASNNRVRASTHLFNNDSDIQTFLQQLPMLLETPSQS